MFKRQQEPARGTSDGYLDGGDAIKLELNTLNTAVLEFVCPVTIVGNLFPIGVTTEIVVAVSFPGSASSACAPNTSNIGRAQSTEILLRLYRSRQ